MTDLDQVLWVTTVLTGLMIPALSAWGTRLHKGRAERRRIRRFGRARHALRRVERSGDPAQQHGRLMRLPEEVFEALVVVVYARRGCAVQHRLARRRYLHMESRLQLDDGWHTVRARTRTRGYASLYAHLFSTECVASREKGLFAHTGAMNKAEARHVKDLTLINSTTLLSLIREGSYPAQKGAHDAKLV